MHAQHMHCSISAMYSACAVHEYKLKRAKNTWPVLSVCTVQVEEVVVEDGIIEKKFLDSGGEVGGCV